MMRLSLCALLVLAACGGSKPKQDHPMQMGSGSATMTTTSDPSCPLEVPGTSVTVEDTANGAALVFVTTGDPAAVRTRAQAFAAMHNKHDGPATAMGMMFPADWKATEKDIDTGARVEFEGSDAAGVQSMLRMHAGHLTSGSCAM